MTSRLANLLKKNRFKNRIKTTTVECEFGGSSTLVFAFAQPDAEQHRLFFSSRPSTRRFFLLFGRQRLITTRVLVYKPARVSLSTHSKHSALTSNK